MYQEIIDQYVPERDLLKMFNKANYAISEIQAQFSIIAYRKGQWRQLAYGIAKLIVKKGYLFDEAYSLLSYETPASDWLRKEVGRLSLELTREQKKKRQEQFLDDESDEIDDEPDESEEKMR